MKPDPVKTLKVALERRFIEVNGRMYTDTTCSYEFWRQYLDVFECVEPIARVGRSARVPIAWRRADGPGVRFHKIHDYQGFWQFLRHLPRVYRQAGRAVRDPSPVLLRAGNISNMCWLHLRSRGRPFAFEGVAHVGEGAALVRNIQYLGLARLIGNAVHRICQRLSAEASCGNYVSEYLRRLYPTRSSQHEWVISDVHLPPEAFLAPRTRDCLTCDPLRIISVGRLEPEKGHAVLIESLALLKNLGREFRCDLVGPGQETDRLRQLARDVGVADRVVFHGAVPPGFPVTALLRQADLFVLPSLTEGLGRALVEAMAAGLPAIGSDTGGIPELLDKEALVPPGDPDALADGIARIGWDRDTMARLSKANYEVAQRYRLDVLKRLRQEFWTCILMQYKGYRRHSGR